ncbi:hemerythrin domain-containing protein [Vibrio sp. RC27]
MIIERIRREHGYMSRLLAILRRKLVLLKDEESVNYSLVKEIVDYLSSHSEVVHHPKEDLIYHYYVEKYGKQADVTDLEEDHKALSAKTHEFLDLIEMVLQDAVVPQDILITQLSEFIKSQKTHLDMEEKEIIPLLLETFTDDDWVHVESQWDHNDDDPVFGESISVRYKQLANRVRQEQ